MIKSVIIHLIVFGSIISAEVATAQTWPTGIEREVDEGFYFTPIAVKNGWRFWEMETKDGVSCIAIKSAVGRQHPVPLGVGGAFWKGTPFLQIHKGYNTAYVYSWSAEHYGKVGVKAREPNAKFWDVIPRTSFDLTKYDGKLVEISVTSWEYPEIYVGLVEEKGMFNFAGVAEATKFVEQCRQ